MVYLNNEWFLQGSSMSTTSRFSSFVRFASALSVIFSLLASVFVATPLAYAAAIPLNTTYAQNFDTLAISGTTNTWTNDSTIEGWYSNRTVYRASAGTDNAGALYSFGSVSATERALGSLASGSVLPLYGVRLVNNTSTTITQLNVNYTGEQWRNDGSSVPNQRLDVSYQINASAIDTGTWIDANGLDFVAPIAAPAVAGPTALNGNDAANRTAISSSISGFSLAPGQEIWLRWQDSNDPGPGGDQGLAIDDLAVSAVIDTTPTLSINNVVLAEGNAGVTTFSFTVSLSAPAGVGGVSFDIATADATATTADGDYLANALTGQVIPQGSSSYTFDVSVNGDTTIESTEVFFVNVTNIVGANPGDSQGQGTITNDDSLPTDTAPSVTNTTPANGASNVAVGDNLSVTFSEAVTAPASAFSLNCGSAVALNVSGGPTTFTLDPASDLPTSANCTLAIDGDQVSDSDTIDPPDTAADVSVSFATAGAVCEQSFTPIYQIQGNGSAAAITGNVTTQGVVVGDFETSSNLSGFYLQDASGDGDATTSDGIFVFTGDSLNAVSAGQLVRVTGFARERFNQTALNGSNSNTAPVPAANIIVCGTGVTPAPVDVTLPVANNTFLERYEGMLVRFTQALLISEYFNFDQFGEIVLALPLAGEPRPFVGTSIDEPGAAALARTAANSLRRITLDDARSSSNPDPARHPNGADFTLGNLFRGGDTVQNATGVLGFDFSLYRIQPTGPADYTATNPRPAAPAAIGGSLKVGAFNTLNFFLTLDYPSSSSLDNACGPAQNLECRGADSDQPDEFTRQRAKLLEAVKGLNADILGLNELENTTGVEPLENIVAGLNAALGAGTYAYIDTDTIGTDAIKVGLIYKPGKVTPIGGFQILDSTDDPDFIDTKSRPVLAQTFEEVATGARFTVAVAHLKSKGSACTDVGDPDLNDGQGNCSQTRRKAADALVDWLATDPTNSGDSDFLIVGDLNSYAKEDAIDEVLAGADDTLGTADDYTNLIAQYLGTYAYSYVFSGEYGYLDHALASASLAAQVTGATEWHINADEPDLLDYDTSFKKPAQDALYEINAYRTSDHDPVLVGLNLNVPVPPCTSVCYADNAGGDDSNPGTQALPKKTIQAAINQVDSGGTVIVAAGTYEETLVASKPVTIEGAGKDVLAKNRAGAQSIVKVSSGGTVGLEIKADNVVINGFVFDMRGADTAWTILRLPQPGDERGNGIQILYNEFIGEGGASAPANVNTSPGGAYLARTDDTLIEGNYFNDSGSHAVFLAGYGDPVASNNAIFRNNDTYRNWLTGFSGPEGKNINVLAENNRAVGDTMYVGNVEGGTFRNNSFEGGANRSSRLSLPSGSNITVENNNFSNPRSQAIYFFTLDGSSNSSNVTIKNNTITQDASYMTTAFQMIDLRNVGGVNEVSSNKVTFTGAYASGVNGAYGIGVRGAATGNTTIKNNELTGTGGASTSVPSASGVVILAKGFDGTALPASAVLNISNNIITGFADGVAVFDASASVYGNLPAGVQLLVELNSLAGNLTNGLITGAGDSLLDGERNWWGSNTGPSSAGNPGGTGDAASGNIDFSPWLCSGTDTSAARGFQPNLNTLCGVAAQLVFSTQPGNGLAGSPLNPQPVVTALDSDGNPAPNFNGAVTLSIGANPGAGTLGGTATVNAIGGVATFSGLSINNAGVGYTLIASASGLPSVTSNAFNVTFVSCPATPVLDTFNRANGSLRSGGKQWFGPEGLGGYAINSNQVQVFGGGPIYWNGPSYGASQEAYFTLTTVDATANEQSLLLKVQGGTPNWRNGAIDVNFLVTRGVISIDTYQPKNNGPFGGWRHYPEIPVTFANGDQFAVRALADGKVQVFKNCTLVGTIDTTGPSLNSDNTLTFSGNGSFFVNRGGRIGVWHINASNGRFDNFGGGTYTP
jgi:predicted extracellular nuclease